MAKREMDVVKGLDLKRYMGRWYEIASFPSFFQPKNGVNTRATYALNEDGTVHVLNETWSNGKRMFIEGTAYKADPKSDEAKLKGQEQGSDTLKNESPTNCLNMSPEILCRSNNHHDETIYNRLLEKARDEGFDVSSIRKTSQTDPPPEANPEDTKGLWWLKSMFGK